MSALVSFCYLLKVFVTGLSRLYPAENPLGDESSSDSPKKLNAIYRFN